MKRLISARLLRLGFTSLFLLVASAGAHAGGTAPGTDIDNQATLNYKVGTTDQPAVTSDGDSGTAGNQATTFKVDRKVDLTVVSNGGATVIPNSNDQALPFTLTNTGNDSHGYLLSTIAGLDATDDDFDMNSVRIYIDIGIVGTYESGTDTLYTGGTNVGDLIADGSINLLVVSNAPGTAGDTETSLYHLLAQATDAGTTTPAAETVGADDPTVVDTAFAEAAGSAGAGTDDAQDGKHSASGTYTVQSASVLVTKSSEVTDDGFGTTAPNAKAIPGATVTYTVNIVNSGAAVANSLVLTDDLQVADVTYNDPSVTFSANCNGVNTESFATPTLTINVGTVTSGSTCTLTYTVTIK
jgi:uncharacterized repeat protein (TIGR01451 family)